MTRSEIYDFLYKEGEMIFAEYNLCDVRDGHCADHRKAMRAYCGGCFPLDFCCNGCKHLSSTGCKVKALYCKLWFCDHTQLPRIIKRRLEILRHMGYLHKMMRFRASKKESLHYGDEDQI